MERRLISVCLILLLSIGLYAQESADAVAQKARFFSTGETQRIVAKLTVELGAEKKLRDLELLYLSSAGTDNLLARVVSPAFLREMKVLLVSSGGQWNTWIKTSQGVKRLGSSARGEALFQSDFLTSDFIIPQSGWGFARDDGSTGVRVLIRTGVRGEDFKQQKLYLRTIDSVVIKRSYYDAEGKLIREYNVVEWEAMRGTAERPAKIELSKNSLKGRSFLEIVSISTDEQIPEGLFLPGSL